MSKEITKRRVQREQLRQHLADVGYNPDDVSIVLGDYVRSHKGEITELAMSSWVTEEMFWGMVRADVDNVALYRLLRSKELVSGGEERRSRWTVGQRLAAMVAELVDSGSISAEDYDESYVETAYFLAERYITLGMVPRSGKQRVMEMLLRKVVPPGTRPGDPSDVKDEPEV